MRISVLTHPRSRMKAATSRRCNLVCYAAACNGACFGWCGRCVRLQQEHSHLRLTSRAQATTSSLPSSTHALASLPEVIATPPAAHSLSYVPHSSAQQRSLAQQCSSTRRRYRQRGQPQCLFTMPIGYRWVLQVADQHANHLTEPPGLLLDLQRTTVWRSCLQMPQGLLHQQR